MRGLRRFLSLFAFFLCLAPFLSEAALPPAPHSEDIFVQDYAGMVTADDRAYMTELGRALDAACGAQLAAVTVDSLDGMPVEDYAVALFRSWRLGDATKNNGVLLLVARRERSFRIEVGYGLEGAIPDGYAGAVLDGMKPGFREGRYSLSMRWAYEELAKRIDAEHGGAAGIDARVAAHRESANAPGASFPGGDGAPHGERAAPPPGAAASEPFDTALLFIGGALLLYLVYSIWAYGFWRGLGNFLVFLLRMIALSGSGRGGSSRGGRGGSSGGGGSSGRW